jgi:hypothetical protein
MDEQEKISVGAWIRSRVFPGIWRVSRVLSGFNELRWSLEAPARQSTRILVFCDRVVNNDWKRAFKTQCCEISYVTLLNPDDCSKLGSVLSADARLREGFAKYQALPHPIDLIGNISFGGMSEETVREFPSICDEVLGEHIGSGLTVHEVLELLEQRGLLEYRAMSPTRATLQLTCVDHEVRSNEFVFRRYRTRYG